MSNSESRSATDPSVQSVVMRLWKYFRRTPRVRNAVELESAELAALSHRMELVEVEASFSILQNEISKARDAAIVKGDWKRADALESCLLGILRAKVELASA